MRRPAARHARTPVRRLRTLCSLVAAMTAAATLPLAVTSTPAQATDPCLVPQVTDVMVSQGLPSYERLTRGKRTLVRYFLATPTCAPTGTVLEVVGGRLDMFVWPEGTTRPAQPTASVSQLSSTSPGGAAPPLAVGPVPSYSGDALFVVPGDLLMSTNAKRLTAEFVATLQYEVNGSSQVLTAAPVAKTVERPSNPLRILVVPMGNPADVASAFPPAARRAVHTGMEHLARILPVADVVREMNPADPAQSDRSPLGIRYAINPGLLDVSEYMPPSAPRFCGSGDQFDAIETKLVAARDAYNTALAAAGRRLQNPALKADVVLGVVWRGISRGPLTGEADSSSCAEGYARIAGVAAWSRLIGPVDDQDTSVSVTGSISAMEVIHLLGGIQGDHSDGNFHASGDEADGDAPNRAWNTAVPAYIPHDRTVMKFDPTGWDDTTTLLSSQEYTFVQCALTPPLPGESIVGQPCPAPGGVGGRYGVAAGQEDNPSGVQEAIYLSGMTDGTPGGTDVRSYVQLADPNRLPLDSDFRVVQSNGATVLRDEPVTVAFDQSAHPQPDHDASDKGSLSVALPLDPQTQRIQLVKVVNGTYVELYSRSRSLAPRIVGAALDKDALTVTVEDDTPDDLRLNVSVKCDDVAYPVLTDLVGERVLGSQTVVFSATYVGSTDCPLGVASFTVTDGFLSTVQDANPRSGPGTPFAAIYTPLPGAEVTPEQVVTLSGAARDAQGRAAARVEWTLTSAAGSTTYTSRSVVLAEPLAVGLYTVRLRGLDLLGNEVASSTTSFEVLPDADEDGLSDEVESQVCPNGKAVDVPWLDADGDARPNASDPLPCVSSHRLAVEFGAQTLNSSSNGLPVTMHVTAPPEVISSLDVTELFVDQLGYYGLDTSGCPLQDPATCPLPALRLDVTGSTTATVKFDRGALTQLLTAKQLSGYVPIVLATAHGLRGSDPTYPTYSK